MSFDYDKIAHKDGEHSSWWTSYADLFMMLSIVFLLMYVATSLRSGSAGLIQQQENKVLSEKAAGLESQIKVYNTLKDEALQKSATEAEQQVYAKLMDKLSLLKEEAKDEKIMLRRKAKENEDKEFALNQYQQLVKNIISANILAKSQIIHRDQIIVSKDATIEEKKQKIAEMEEIVAQNDQQIANIHQKLETQIQALRDEQQSSQSSKAAMERKIAALRADSQQRVDAIEAKKAMIAQELTDVKSTLAETSQKLDSANTTIVQQDQTIEQKNQTIQQQEEEKGKLAAKLAQDETRYAQELQDAKAAHEQQLADEKARFMDNLKKQKLSADAEAKRIAQFADAARDKAAKLEEQLGGLKEKIEDTDSRLRNAQGEYEAAKAKLAGTQQQLAGTQQALAGTKQQLAGTKEALAQTEADKGRALAAVSGLEEDLAKTRAIANARKVLAKQIADELGKAGIKGNVDGKTGEVTLDFGGEYFETGSTTLKPNMKSTLDKFIPTYAKSLFANPKLADKIGNVEIIGFASSTYQGRYVNPKSTKPEDKAAIEYNLKLSFGRANAIFEHVLKSKTLTQDEREKLMPIMKVVGRGYLPDGMSLSDLPDSMNAEDFCDKYNCKKAQRVVVKFNMKD